LGGVLRRVRLRKDSGVAFYLQLLLLADYVDGRAIAVRAGVLRNFAFALWSSWSGGQLRTAAIRREPGFRDHFAPSLAGLILRNGADGATTFSLRDSDRRLILLMKINLPET